MSLDRMKASGRQARGIQRERERGQKRDRERNGGDGRGEARERRAKENAAALPANSQRPAIFTRPIK
jgi:hypothetical protein